MTLNNPTCLAAKAFEKGRSRNQEHKMKTSSISWQKQRFSRSDIQSVQMPATIPSLSQPWVKSILWLNLEVKLEEAEQDPARQLTSLHKNGRRCFVFCASEASTEHFLVQEGCYQALRCQVGTQHNSFEDKLKGSKHRAGNQANVSISLNVLPLIVQQR